MDTESQPIEEPIVPPAEEADPLTDMLLATQPAKVSGSSQETVDGEWQRKYDERQRKVEEAWKLREQSLLAQYNALDTKLNSYGDNIALTIDQAIPTLAEMEAFLSRKGRHKLSGVADELKLMNFPKWGEYLKSYAEKYDLSVRSLQRRLHEYRGEANSESHPKRDTPKVRIESSDEFIARLVAESQAKREKGSNKGQDRVPVIEESLASQLCKEGAHLARAVKIPPVSRDTLIKMADAYLEKMHGNTIESESALPELAPEPPATESWTEENEDAEEAKRRELYPLASLADYLLRIADELGAHGV